MNPETNVDGALRRAALLFRLLAVAWMAVMVTITVFTDDSARLPVVLGAMAVAALGAAWSVRHLLSERPLDMRFLVVDGVVAMAVAISPQLAGAAEGFYGGYPMSWVVMVALARNVGGGLGAAAIFSATQLVALVMRAPSGPSPSEWISLSVMAGIVALVVGLGVEFLRSAEARRTRAEEQLEEERRRHAVQQARLAERMAMADDLHDSLLQTVRVLGQSANDADRVRALARRQERELQDLIERMDGTGSEAATALRRDAADIEDLHGVEVDVVATGRVELDDATGELVRAAREAIVNAARHSGASRIDVTLEANSASVTVVIRDRGRGFDPGAVTKGHGLGSIEERLARVGGWMTVHSSAGEGTEVEMSIPRVRG
ncbi:MAG TPA: ATP-binding protein [Acidimicrobiia bacterium]|nr:ATP-binding protein [Acidimicrobiia bacterium]